MGELLYAQRKKLPHTQGLLWEIVLVPHMDIQQAERTDMSTCVGCTCMVFTVMNALAGQDADTPPFIP